MAAAPLPRSTPFRRARPHAAREPLSSPQELQRYATVRIAEGEVKPRQMLEEALDTSAG